MNRAWANRIFELSNTSKKRVLYDVRWPRNKEGILFKCYKENKILIWGTVFFLGVVGISNFVTYILLKGWGVY